MSSLVQGANESVGNYTTRFKAQMYQESLYDDNAASQKGQLYLAAYVKGLVQSIRTKVAGQVPTSITTAMLQSLQVEIKDSRFKQFYVKLSDKGKPKKTISGHHNQMDQEYFSET